MRSKDQILLERAYQKIYEEVETSAVENEDDDKFSRVREWMDKNPIKGVNEYWDDMVIFKKYFIKRLYELAEDKKTREYFYDAGLQDDIINDLIDLFVPKEKETLEDGTVHEFPVVKTPHKKIIGKDDVYNHYYEMFWRQQTDSSFGDDWDEDSEDADYGYNDPTGQDEPMDTRTYSEIEMSDRLDAASRMDPDQAAEYRRGA